MKEEKMKEIAGSAALADRVSTLLAFLEQVCYFQD